MSYLHELIDLNEGIKKENEKLTKLFESLTEGCCDESGESEKCCEDLTNEEKSCCENTIKEEIQTVKEFMNEQLEEPEEQVEEECQNIKESLVEEDGTETRRPSEIFRRIETQVEESTGQENQENVGVEQNQEPAKKEPEQKETSENDAKSNDQKSKETSGTSGMVTLEQLETSTESFVGIIDPPEKEPDIQTNTQTSESNLLESMRQLRKYLEKNSK